MTGVRYIQTIIINIAVLILISITFLILFQHYRHFNADFLTRYINSKCELNHADDDWLYREKLVYNNTSGAGRWTVSNLNRQHHHHQESPNYLRSYSSAAVADCFDSIRVKCPSFSPVLRIVFIGDSRIRNQFFNFIKFLPKIDLEFEPALMQVGLESVFDFQKDRTVSSSFMGLQLSYLWRPRLDDELINSMEGFIEKPPYLIITGLASHHIIKRIIDSPHHHNLEIFEKRMKDFLVPIMKRFIAVGTRIIWMNQFPMLGLPLDHKEPDNTNEIGRVTTELLEVANRLSRRLLKDTGVKFWDSGNQAVEENARACAPLNGALKRDPYTEQFSHETYFKCDDLIHPSYVSISHMIQILFNHLCNRYT